jgi:outer membrane scaffolding protein for murein synthesis (MipA/OmpV family)
VSVLRGQWQATDKISTYAFAGNDFQPGYDGGAARWVARLGYGINWAVTEKLDLRGTAFHDYQEAIAGNAAYDQVQGELRTFLAASARYQFTDRFSSEFGVRHNNDEKDPEQNIVFVNVSYDY